VGRRGYEKITTKGYEELESEVKPNSDIEEGFSFSFNNCFTLMLYEKFRDKTMRLLSYK